MISRRIDRGPQASSFKRLGYYLLDAKTQDAQILWTLTEGTDQNRVEGKVLWTRITNCIGIIPVMAIAEIETTQALNTRCKSDKTYHLVVSFPYGERPTREQLEDIEDTLCQVIGLGEHQRISAVHQDTDNLHLHVAINKIHPQTLKISNPWMDNFKRDKACRELELKHGLLIDNGIGQSQTQVTGRAQDMEAFTGEESFQTWVKETVKDSLLQAQSWPQMHDLLNQHGLVIKLRGAGLVIGTQDDKLHVKASVIDRQLSFKALTDRLGAYEAPLYNQSVKQDQSRNHTYRQGPKDKGQGSQLLWEKYQQEREALVNARQGAYTQLRTCHYTYCKELSDWYRQKRASVKANDKLNRKSKFELYRDYEREMKSDFRQRRQLESDQRQTIQDRYATLNWDQWLTKEVSQGNQEALRLLRKREDCRRQFTRNLLSISNPDAMRTLIYAHLKPKANKYGDLVYHLPDGGRVDDTPKGILVPKVSDEATLLALKLVKASNPVQTVMVNGSESFKANVIQTSVSHGLELRFVDQVMQNAMEQLRIGAQADQSKEQGHTQSHAIKPKRERYRGR